MRSLRQYVCLMAVSCAAFAARAVVVTNTLVETSSGVCYHYQSTLEQFKGLDIAVDRMYPGWRVVAHHSSGAGYVIGETEFPVVSYLDFRDRKYSVEFPGAKDFYARFNWVEKYTTEEMAYYNGWLHFKEETDGNLTLVESQMETVPGYRVLLPKVIPQDPVPRRTWNFEDSDPCAGIVADGKYGMGDSYVESDGKGHVFVVDSTEALKFPCGMPTDTNVVELAFRYFSHYASDLPPKLEGAPGGGTTRLIVAAPGFIARVDSVLAFGLCEIENPDWSLSRLFMLTTPDGTYALAGADAERQAWYDVVIRIYGGRAIVLVNGVALSSDGRTEFDIGDGTSVGWLGFTGYGRLDDVSIMCKAQPVGFDGLGAEIPVVWAAGYKDFTRLYGEDFSAALMKPTGKKGSDGRPLRVWHDFVMGTDPTDPDDVLKVSLRMDKDRPVLEWRPNAPAALGFGRTYTVYGKRSLEDASWSVADPNDLSPWCFFKVGVSVGEEGVR